MDFGPRSHQLACFVLRLRAVPFVGRRPALDQRTSPILMSCVKPQVNPASIGIHALVRDLCQLGRSPLRTVRTSRPSLSRTRDVESTAEGLSHRAVLRALLSMCIIVCAAGTGRMSTVSCDTSLLFSLYASLGVCSPVCSLE